MQNVLLRAGRRMAPWALPWLLGSCGPMVRATYLGNGAIGLTSPALLTAPAHDWRADSATRVAGHTQFAGGYAPGPGYNPGDRQWRGHLTAERVWQHRSCNLSIGAIGYQGRYHLSPDYGGSGQWLGYQGAGLAAGLSLHKQRGSLDVRYCTVQVLSAYEWGPWATFCRQAPNQLPGYQRDRAVTREVQQLPGRAARYQAVAVSFGLTNVPRRRQALVIGTDLVVVVTNQVPCVGVQGCVGAGPLRLYASVLGVMAEAQASRSLGLAWIMPATTRPRRIMDI